MDLQSSRRWLLSLLQKLLGNTCVRRSVQGFFRLYSLLWQQLRRFGERSRKTFSDKGLCRTPPPSFQIKYSRSDDSTAEIPLCPSIQPPAPVFKADTLRPHDVQEAVYGHASMTIQGDHNAASLHPYVFSQPTASLSSQNIGMASMEEYNTTPIAIPPFARPYTPARSHYSEVVPFNSRPASRRDLAIPPGGSPNLSLQDVHRLFFPIPPTSFERYDRNVTIPKGQSGCIIEPLTVIFTPDAPVGWTPFRHPEGALYFFHEQKKILTDAHLYDPNVFVELQTFMDQMDDFLRANNIEIAPDVHRVLDLSPNENGITVCGYYFADPKNRSIFWLDPYDTSSICSGVQGVSSIYQMRYELEAQYWHHCDLFPHTQHLTKELVSELRDMVSHNIADLITSSSSNSPYGLDDLRNMQSLLDNVEKDVNTKFGGSVCVITRLMENFVRNRFVHFHGQPGARLERNQHIYGNPGHRRSFVMATVSPLLFSAPDIHLRTLQELWVDQVVCAHQWNKVITKLNDEWQEFTLYAQVLLNANVAFLAIQSVDSASTTPHRSPAQIASYLSTVASVGSIILGLLLVRQNRTKNRETAGEAAAFFERRTRFPYGLEILALLYSLPYALLMWAMVSFLAAFSFECFLSSDNLTRVVVGSAWFAIAGLILWCVCTAWESEHSFLLWKDWFSRTFSPLLEKMKISKRPTRLDDESSQEKPILPTIFCRHSCRRKGSWSRSNGSRISVVSDCMKC